MTRILIKSKGNNSLFMNLTRDSVSVSGDSPYLLENSPNVSDCKLLASKSYKGLIEVCSDDDSVIKTYLKSMPMIKIDSIEKYIKSDSANVVVDENKSEATKIETFQNTEVNTEVISEPSIESKQDEIQEPKSDDILENNADKTTGIFQKKKNKSSKE